MISSNRRQANQGREWECSIARPVLAAGVLLGCSLACASSSTASSPPTAARKAAAPIQEQLQVYFGNLHAHSRLSDGNPDTTAAEAFQIARDDGGLDFLCLSEHNHMLDASEMAQLIAAADVATGNGFVAMFGQEYSTIANGGNHANIHNYPVAIPAALNGHYQQVFQTLLPQFLLGSPDTIIVAGFNHPRSDIARDYGLGSDFGGDRDAFVAAMDPFVRLIAISNGPSDSDHKDNVPSAGDRHLHTDQSTARWFDYLAMGMHLAPEMSHDTHSPTYGFRVAGRTAVWAPGTLTRAKLLAALASRHVYATEEPTLLIMPSIAGGGLPGDILRPATEGPLSVTLDLQDSDEPTAAYEVEVYSGITGTGVRPTELTALSASRSGNGPVTLGLPTEQDIRSYFVLHVRQTSSDPLSGCSSDDAWLAPIWVEWADDDDAGGPTVAFQFVGSRRSGVYHVPECSVVGQISQANLVHYESAPAGKRLHQGCPSN